MLDANVCVATHVPGVSLQPPASATLHTPKCPVSFAFILTSDFSDQISGEQTVFCYTRASNDVLTIHTHTKKRQFI